MGSVKLTLNIGAKDARRLNLEKTLRGETVKVSKQVEDELIQNGWAIRSDAEGFDAEVVDAASAATNAETFPSRRPRVEVANPSEDVTPKGEKKSK